MALKSRRQEIERCLAKADFLHRPHRLSRRPTTTAHVGSRSRKLCDALVSLGPVFSAFGLYLSSRFDLLPEHDCHELATIPDWAEATPSATVREMIDREIGSSQEALYPVFEDTPFESRLIFQSHRAWLANGKAVTVKVVHPELEGYLECDLELLPILKRVFPCKGRSDILFEDAIADFRRLVQWQTDLTYASQAFEALAQDAHTFAMLRVPIVYQSLSSSTVLTLEYLHGVSLKEMIASSNTKSDLEGHATPSAVPSNAEAESHELARRLCLVWLHQALLGLQFPVELYPENIVILPNKQLALTGGTFTSLPADAKKNLWQYLIASSIQDPDKACSFLLQEMIYERHTIDESELRYRFREIVPFRDRVWKYNENSNNLADYLFVHWKLLSQNGLRPQSHTLSFYRGLFQTVASVQQLASSSDPLLEGLQDVRSIVMLAQFEDMTELRQISAHLDKYAAIIMQVPKRLDDALTLAAESSMRLKLQGTWPTGHRRQQNFSAVVISLLLVLVAVVLLSHYLAALTPAGAWVDRVSAIVFVVIGALVLRAISRA